MFSSFLRRSRAQLAALLTLLAGLLALGGPFIDIGHAQAQGVAIPVALDTEAIDRYVTTEMASARLPGAALAIVQDDQILYLKGYGVADRAGTPVTPQTPFTLGSTSKSFTALATMQLVEAGKLELDAPVQRYLPWFRVATADASGAITVRHLLAHTSGLPARAGLTITPQGDDPLDELEQAVRDMHTVELVAPPGSTFQYSNANYQLLGLLVEVASGRSFEAYLAEHILAPLGMTRTFTSPEEARAQGRAVGHRYWFGYPVPYEMAFNRAHLASGFLNSSAEDLASYLVAQLNNGHAHGRALLSPEGMETLHTPLVYTGNPVGKEAYAMGWFVTEMEDLTFIHHAGSTANFYSDLLLVPERGLGVALVMNGQDALHGARIAGIAPGVLDLALGRTPEPPGTTSLYQLALFVVGGVLIAQLFGFASTLRLLRRWRRTDLADYPLWKLLLRVAPPVVLSGLWVVLCLVVLPQLFATPLPTMVVLVPDFSTVLLLSSGWGLGWGLVRPLLLITTWRAQRPGPAPNAPLQPYVSH